jgi:hypothetical protein
MRFGQTDKNNLTRAKWPPSCVEIIYAHALKDPCEEARSDAFTLPSLISITFLAICDDGIVRYNEQGASWAAFRQLDDVRARLRV